MFVCMRKILMDIKIKWKRERKIGPFIFTFFYSRFWHLFFPMNKQLRRKMKRPFDALEVNVNSDANTIPAPIGRSTWLCTITHNNNKIGHTDGVEREAQEFLPSASIVTITTTTVDWRTLTVADIVFHCIVCPFTSSNERKHIVYIVSVFLFSFAIQKIFIISFWSHWLVLLWSFSASRIWTLL